MPTIAPRRNARFSRAKDPPPYWLERDAVLRRIKAEGRYVWRTASGATRQSLAENAVSRFKALLGVKLVSRNFENQQVEALVKCQVLNRMAALGLPRSEHSAGLSCPEREDGGSGCVEAGLRNNAILPQRNRYEEQEWYKGRPQSYTCLLFGEISETDYPQSVRAAFGKEACEVYQTWAYMKE